MENSKENIYNYEAKEPKTIVYDYLFNYFGGDTFKGKIIMGASVQLAIKVYKDSKEIKFLEEPKEETTGKWFNQNYKISFDKEKIFTIEKNMYVDNIFRIMFGWEKIDCEVVGYSLDYLDELPKEIKEQLPKEVQGFPCSAPMQVTEKEFRTFLQEHVKDFDISDNKCAQVPSVSFI